MKELFFEIAIDMDGERVDKCLSLLADTFTRSYLQKLIKDGQVFVNEKPVKTNHRLKEGDVVALSIPEATKLQIEPEDLSIDILYEDEDILVVNKPKDMVVHPAPGHYSHTLVNALLFHCKDSLSGINGVMRPGIVHRIDKDTTGSLLVCKNDVAHQMLAEQLKDHSITRKYRGIVYGVVKLDHGSIQAPIGRHPHDRKKMAVNPQNGKEAITHYQVIERFANYTYLEFTLETGRTHQIRVHLASIGHPLLGDTTYAGNRKEIFTLTGQTLHAMVLGFKHPVSQSYLEVTAPLPAYFVELLEVLRRNR